MENKSCCEKCRDYGTEHGPTICENTSCPCHTGVKSLAEKAIKDYDKTLKDLAEYDTVKEPKKKKPIEWEREFNETFNYASFCWNGDNATGAKFAKQTMKKVKDFIRRIAATEREKVRSEVVKEIEGMAKDTRGSFSSQFTKGYAKGKNDTLSDLAARLSVPSDKIGV